MKIYFFTINLFKHINPKVNIGSTIYLFLDIYFLLNLLAKMDNNACIKTEPTAMTDYEVEVNIHNINMNRLLILFL